METIHKREAWNNGKLVGQKPPLKPKDIWAIRIYLQNAHAVRDLAMFNLAIDGKLRGCDFRNAGPTTSLSAWWERQAPGAYTSSGTSISQD